MAAGAADRIAQLGDDRRPVASPGKRRNDPQVIIAGHEQQLRPGQFEQARQQLCQTSTGAGSAPHRRLGADDRDIVVDQRPQRPALVAGDDRDAASPRRPFIGQTDRDPLTAAGREIVQQYRDATSGHGRRSMAARLNRPTRLPVRACGERRQPSRPGRSCRQAVARRARLVASPVRASLPAAGYGRRKVDAVRTTTEM